MANYEPFIIDLSSNLSSYEPVGKIAVCTDTGEIKYHEGSGTWTTLITISSAAVKLPDGVIATGDVVLPNTSGVGIKIGDADSSDFGWRDITGEVQTRGVGATDPAWTQIGASAMYAFSFAINDVCWMAFHVPHDYIPGSGWYLHVHWLPDGTDANSVKWSFSWMYAKGHNQAAFNVASLTTDTMTQTVGGTQYQHYVTESGEQSGTNVEPDGIIYVKITRVTNGGTDNTDEILMLTSDVHYQSNNLATKNKSPNFYT